MKENDPKIRAFASVAFPRIVEAEKARNDEDDYQETAAQGLVRMTLEYISGGLMDWDSATIFLKGVFDQIGEVDIQ
jgi:hypothetical protein